MRAQGLVNLVVRGLLRTPGLSRMLGSRLVTLYVVGRKSGSRYIVPVSYLAQGDHLLIGTNFGWARNLRTGEPVALRFKGRIRWADVQTLTAEPDVVTAYAHMASRNPAFARFSKVHVDQDGNANHRGPAFGLGWRRAGHQAHTSMTALGADDLSLIPWDGGSPDPFHGVTKPCW
jgi:deazaflavin-dependent oxidoreductase (nitroreductase family)